jgi:splicing factor 3A subunit 2
MSREHGSKIGSGGVASQGEAEQQRKKRLRELMIETINQTQSALGQTTASSSSSNKLSINDPYLMRNHLGSYECRLCLTIHLTEGSFLIHCSAKKHQENLRRRKNKMEIERREKELTTMRDHKKNAPINIVTNVNLTEEEKERKKALLQSIGQPLSKIVRLRDPHTFQLSLLFCLTFPNISVGIRPRYRFLSPFEQSIDPPNSPYNYLVFAADPYANVAFRIPKYEIDRKADRFFTHWDEEKKSFYLQFYFVQTEKQKERERKEKELLDRKAKEIESERQTNESHLSQSSSFSSEILDKAETKKRKLEEETEERYTVEDDEEEAYYEY